MSLFFNSHEPKQQEIILLVTLIKNDATCLSLQNKTNKGQHRETEMRTAPFLDPGSQADAKGEHCFVRVSCLRHTQRKISENGKNVGRV